ncbi:MAG TPA: immunoglobulin domain-containing protein, partial [Candidatus Hydrogenedentes bacterium]|nr:immunoglobulin domain-containing protein [Candidatus Hydrogenedentota bacterium]
MFTARQISGRRGMHCSFAAIIVVAVAAATSIAAWAGELVAPSGRVLDSDVISGGGVYLSGTGHGIQSAVGQTAIGVSQGASRAVVNHGWPPPDPEPLQVAGPLAGEKYLNDPTHSFTATTTGGVPPYTFQWQFSTDPGFATPAPISAGLGGHPGDPAVTVTIGGVIPDSILSFGPMTIGVVGYYRCVATDTDLTEAISAVVFLDVQPAVGATDPVGGHRNTGGSMTFSTTASNGYTPYSYAWYKSPNPTPLSNGPTGGGSTISGAATADMTISNLQLADAGDYYCVVTDRLVSGSGSTKQTAAAAMTVTDLLTIAGPVPAEARIYGTAQNFEVTATGGSGPANYTFLWEWDPDGFGTGNPAFALSTGTHPNTQTQVTISNPSPDVSRLAMSSIIQSANGEYRCTVSDTSPDPDAVSAAAILEKRIAVTVTNHPATPVTRGQYVDTLSLSVTATGGFAPLNYQWEYSSDGGGTWNPVADGITTHVRPGHDPLLTDPCNYLVPVDVEISGATSSTLLVDHPLYQVHTGQYRCVVTDSYPGDPPLPQGTATSNASVVTIRDKMAVVRQPVGGEYYDGNVEYINVAVIGGVPVPATPTPENPCPAPDNYTFGWRFMNVAMLNSPRNPMKFDPVKSGTAPAPPFIYPDAVGYSGNYSVTVTYTGIPGLPSGDALITSQAGAILVQPAVSFLTAPQDETKNVTDSVTFTAEATGGYPGYTYAWNWNGNLLVNGNHPSGSGAQVSGAGTTSITITDLGEADAGTYAVVVNDSKAPCSGPTPGHQDKCTATASATLVVTNNILIEDDPDDLDVYHGDNVSFSVTPVGGQPSSYSYEWYWDFGAPEGAVQLENGPHPSGTGATVSGATSATLQIAGVRLGATPNTRDAGQYYAIVRDAVPQNNAGQSAPATLGVYAAVSVTTHPAAANRYAGESVSFSVAATGGLLGQRNYRWQRSTDGGLNWSDLSDGGGVSGATTTTLTLASVALGDDASRYRCRVTSLPSDVSSPSFNWETESNAAVLRVSAPLVLLDRPADVQAYVTDPVFQLRVHFEGGMPGYSSQWRRSGLDPVSPEVGAGTGTIILGDPNTTVLAVSPASLSPGLYAYAAELTDQVKTTRSDVGTVEIANNLQFVRGLTNQAVRARQRFEWSIEVSGGLGGVHYQWYKFEAEGGKAFVPIVDDGAHYGAQTSSLTFVEVAAEDDG